MKRMINITPNKKQYTPDEYTDLLITQDDTTKDPIDRILRLALLSLIWVVFLLPLLYLSMNNDTAYSIMQTIFIIPCILALSCIIYALASTLIKDTIAFIKNEEE